jgi:hypothetical protein
MGVIISWICENNKIFAEYGRKSSWGISLLSSFRTNGI